MSSDAEVMIPVPKVVKISGDEVTIPKIKVKHVTSVLKLIRPFVGKLETSSKLDVLSLVEDNMPEVVSLLALLMGWPKDKVENLDLDEMVELTAGVLEVNFDFFAQKVLPSLLEAMGRLGGLSSNQVKQLGQTPSNT